MLLHYERGHCAAAQLPTAEAPALLPAAPERPDAELGAADQLLLPPADLLASVLALYALQPHLRRAQRQYRGHAGQPSYLDRLGSAQLSSARLDSTRLDSTRLDATRRLAALTAAGIRTAVPRLKNETLTTALWRLPRCHALCAAA